MKYAMAQIDNVQQVMAQLFDGSQIDSYEKTYRHTDKTDTWIVINGQVKTLLVVCTITLILQRREDQKRLSVWNECIHHKHYVYKFLLDTYTYTFFSVHRIYRQNNGNWMVWLTKVKCVLFNICEREVRPFVRTRWFYLNNNIMATMLMQSNECLKLWCIYVAMNFPSSIYVYIFKADLPLRISCMRQLFQHRRLPIFVFNYSPICF